MRAHIVCAVLLTLYLSVSCEVNERYIVLLHEGVTEGHLEDLINRIELHSSSTRDEMFIETDNSLIPLIYGNFNNETAKMVIPPLFPK